MQILGLLGIHTVFCHYIKHLICLLGLACPDDCTDTSQGICDSTSGTCTCMAGFSGDNCAGTFLTMYNFLIDLLKMYHFTYGLNNPVSIILLLYLSKREFQSQYYQIQDLQLTIIIFVFFFIKTGHWNFPLTCMKWNL